MYNPYVPGRHPIQEPSVILEPALQSVHAAADDGSAPDVIYYNLDSEHGIQSVVPRFSLYPIY